MFYPLLDVTQVDPLHLLAVAAHPGDAEWFCGGLLHQVASQGKRVGILDLTNGDMAERGTPQQRLKEADDAAAALGIAWRGNLGLPDGRLENHIMARMTLAGIIRSLRPTIVIGPHPQRSYPDHAYAAAMLRDACHASGWGKLDDDLEPFAPQLILQGAADALLPPTVLAPLREEDLQSKGNALLCYQSQLEALPGERPVATRILPFHSEQTVTERVRALAVSYGLAGNLALAEPFYTERPLVLQDLSLLTSDSAR